MKRLSMNISIYVPSWNMCNLDNTTQIKKLCPFCNKDTKGYYCALYMERLDRSDGVTYKTASCIKNTATRGATVEHEQEAASVVEPKKLMKMTLDEYDKTYNSLINQGYPVNMARKVAREYLLS